MKQRTRLAHNGDELLGDMSNKKNEDFQNDDIPLHKVRPQEYFIEAQVQEGDTLQAIALRFHCSLSELKRINHIHKDNEIFARRTIKVPVTPYSVLTELIETPQTEVAPSSSKQVLANQLLQDLQNDKRLIDLNNISGTNNDSNNYTIDCNTIVLNSTVKPSVVPYVDSESSEPITEDTHLLPNKENIPVESVVVKELTSHGADFGLKWFHLVALIVVLCVVTPIVYVLFYLDKHEHSDIPPLHAI